MHKHSLYGEGHQSAFLKVFGSTPQLRLLDFFMDNPMNDFSRNGIIEAIGMVERALYGYLPLLVEEEVVRESMRIGRVELYALNLDSPAVRCFMRLEEELTRPEKSSLAESEETVSKIIQGSRRVEE